MTEGPQPGGYVAYGRGYGGGPFGQPRAPGTGIVPLRPLSVSEILDGAFTAIRWNPKTILATSAAVITSTAVFGAVLSYVAQREVLANVRVPGASNALADLARSGVWLALESLNLVIGLIAGVALTGLLTVAVGQGVLGRKETIASAWRASRRRVWRLIAMLLLGTAFFIAEAALVAGLTLVADLLLGAVAAVVIGVIGGLAAWVFAMIVAVRWSIAIPVVMLERVGPLASLVRSWRLTRRSWWRVFGILLLTYLTILITAIVMETPFLIVGGALAAASLGTQVNIGGLILTAIGEIVAGTVTAPLVAGVIVLLYADLRMRREGIDIMLQATSAADRPVGQNASPW